MYTLLCRVNAQKLICCMSVRSKYLTRKKNASPKKKISIKTREFSSLLCHHILNEQHKTNIIILLISGKFYETDVSSHHLDVAVRK